MTKYEQRQGQLTKSNLYKKWTNKNLLLNLKIIKVERTKSYSLSKREIEDQMTKTHKNSSIKTSWTMRLIPPNERE